LLRFLAVSFEISYLGAKMSLFGAAKKTSTFQRAKERLEKMEKEEERKTRESTPAESFSTEESSHIGAQLDFLGRGQLDPDGTATTSEIAREGLDEDLREVQQAAVVLTREQYNQGTGTHNDEYETHTISSDDSSLSPPPTTSYG
jgi:hypothetical protein